MHEVSWKLSNANSIKEIYMSYAERFYCIFPLKIYFAIPFLQKCQFVTLDIIHLPLVIDIHAELSVNNNLNEKARTLK